MKCAYNPDHGYASWVWTDPISGSIHEDLPMCSKQCADPPVNRPDLVQTWSGLVKKNVSTNGITDVLIYTIKETQ